MTVTSRAVTATGLTGLKHYLKGWYFSETGGVNSFTVTIRVGGATGPILWQHTINKSASVGEDLGEAIDVLSYPTRVADDIHVTITGAGTCQGAVRGR